MSKKSLNMSKVVQDHPVGNRVKDLGEIIDVNGVRASGARGVQITIPRWYARKMNLIPGQTGMEIREIDDCLLLVPLDAKEKFEEAKSKFRDSVQKK